MRRRDVLLGGVAALATTAARAQCVTNGFDIRGCAGVVSTGPAPSLDLNLLAGPLDGRITFTRASTGTYFDAAGVLQTAATNAPRFDADPVTHAARGLLIEEARTNICTNSQAINSWTKTDSTVTDDSTTSPDGTSNASLITEGTAGNALVAGSLAAVAASSVVSFSMFFKRGNNDWVRMLGADTGTANGINVWINLSTGAFSFTARGTATGQSASVTILANGWYRLLATCTLIGTSNAAQLNTSSAVSNGSASKVNNATYYSWGGQVELGAFPTSYIPTTAAAATRAADVPTMPTAGIVTAGTAGTLVGDAQITSAAATAIGYVTQLDDGTTNNRVTMRVAVPPTGVGGLVISGGASQFNAAAGSGLTLTTPFKSGIAWTAGQQITAANGVSGASASGALNPTAVTTLRIGVNEASALPLNGWMRRVRYWPTSLSASQLQAVTT